MRSWSSSFKACGPENVPLIYITNNPVCGQAVSIAYLYTVGHRENKENRRLTNKSKQQNLLSAFTNFVGFVLLVIYTGMMPGELFQLKKDIINWDTYEIKGCGLKTKKRKETPIVFSEVIAPLLLDLCQQSQSRVGNVLCMNRDNFYTKYHDTLKLAGVRDLPPYSCRHTTATALALGNIAPSVIQEVMRHTKFTTTQRYIHPDMASAHYAINSLDKGKAIK